MLYKLFSKLWNDGPEVLHRPRRDPFLLENERSTGWSPRVVSKMNSLLNQPLFIFDRIHCFFLYLSLWILSFNSPWWLFQFNIFMLKITIHVNYINYTCCRILVKSLCSIFSSKYELRKVHHAAWSNESAIKILKKSFPVARFNRTHCCISFLFTLSWVTSIHVDD